MSISGTYRLTSLAVALVLCVVLVTYTACNKKPPDPPNPPVTEYCDTATVSYSQDIIPIIATYCSAPSLGDCHDGTTQDVPGLGNYSGLKTVIDDGTFENLVFNTREMPDPATMGPKVLDAFHELKLKCWIMDGAPDN